MTTPFNLLRSHSPSNCSSLVIFSRSLAEACSDGDVNAVRKLLDEGRSVNEHTEEGESLLCLACSAGYYELAQVEYTHTLNTLLNPLFTLHDKGLNNFKGR